MKHFIWLPTKLSPDQNNPAGWGCRIHQLHLCWGVRLPSPLIECSEYGIKQIDGEALVLLELLGMGSTSSLPLLPVPFWPGMVAAPDKGLIYGSNRYVWSFNCGNKLLMFNWISIHINTWNYLTVCKRMSLGSFKNIISKMFKNNIFDIYV